MKRLIQLLLLLLAALVLGTAAFFFCRHSMHHAPTSTRPELEWLRTEFQLDEKQFARIATLHEQYQPICDTLCTQIATKNAEIYNLIRSNTYVTPALTQAFMDEGALRSSCRVSMMIHIYAVSHEMSPEQGRRYLEMMSTQIACPTPEMTHGHHGKK